jgi:hypothetical protein
MQMKQKTHQSLINVQDVERDQGLLRGYYFYEIEWGLSRWCAERGT